MILDNRLVRFALVGCSNTLISFTIFYFFLLFLSDSSIKGVLAQGISYVPSIFWSYYWNSRWTFQGRVGSNSINNFGAFATAQVIFLVLSSLLVGIGVDYFKFMPTLVWITVSTLIVILNFLASKKIIFDRRTNEH